MKENRGITLIALVITIIVLLILAGVSLRLVAGNEGILNRAEKAVSKSNTESLKEEIELAISELRIAYYEDKETFASADEYIQNKLNGKDIPSGTIIFAQDTGEVRLKDKEGTDSKVVGSYSAEKGLIMKTEDEKVYLNPKDWKYEVDSFGNATLLQYKGDTSSGTVIIPSLIKTDNGNISITKVGRATVDENRINIWAEEICDTNPTDCYLRYPSQITKIVFNTGIESIELEALYNTKNLTEVELPTTLKSIGYMVFGGCDNLSTVNYAGTESQWNSINIGSSNNALKNATINYNYK